MVAAVPKHLRVRVLITVKSMDELALPTFLRTNFLRGLDIVIESKCHRFRGLINVIPALLVSVRQSYRI